MPLGREDYDDLNEAVAENDPCPITRAVMWVETYGSEIPVDLYIELTEMGINPDQLMNDLEV